MQSFELKEQTPCKEKGVKICGCVSGQTGAQSLGTETYYIPYKAEELNVRKQNTI